MRNNCESNRLSFLDQEANITVNYPDESQPDYRIYTLHTNVKPPDLNKKSHPDNEPFSRSSTFSDFQIRVRSGNSMFDGLFALSMEEVEKNYIDVDIIDDNPISCPCFQAGKEWTSVWTRDTAYSVELALALINPVRSKNSLEFKLSDRRKGGNPEIVQDTGSGGSWPVSTDRVVWAMGAWELLKYLDNEERTQFRDRAYEAIVNTINNDRKYVFDHRDGLYRGEQSFLDWRQQTYASWTKKDTVHIGMSKALSTNIDHYAILRRAAWIAKEIGELADQARYDGWAEELKEAINKNFWLSSEGMYSSLKNTELDPAILNKFDLLGESLAIILGIADKSQAKSIMENYPHTIAGPPVIWPQQPLIKIYHNRAIWPFVTAYALRAARLAKNDAAVNHNTMSLMRGTALNLSNMENFEFLHLANWYDDNEYSGPDRNSQYQLWSVAGYLSMVIDVIFGRETEQDGIRFHPFLTKQLRNTCFKDTKSIKLNNLPYKGKSIDIELSLPDVDDQMQGYYEILNITMNGTSVSSDTYFSPEMLNSENHVLIQLVDAHATPTQITIIEDDGEFKRFWAPKEPNLNSITVTVNDNGEDVLCVSYDSNNEKDVVFNIYRNGELVASDLTETSWVDPDSKDYNSKTYCYAVEMRFAGFRNFSHHSKPQCYWTPETIEEISVPDSRLVSNNSAPTEDNHGRRHFNDWGDPEEEIEVTDFQPKRTGIYYIQLVYGNAMGEINTGITCSVKLVEVFDKTTNEMIDSGAVFMPHLESWETWGDSSFFPVSLDKKKTYRVLIKDAYNMSYLQHFRSYLGEGGNSGPNNRVNFSGVKFLAMEKTNVP